MKSFIFFSLFCIPFSYVGSLSRFRDLDEETLETDEPRSGVLFTVRPDPEEFAEEINPPICHKCGSRSLFEKVTRLNVKREILRKLGLKTAPIVNKTNSDFPKQLITKLIKEAQKREFMAAEYDEMSDEPFGYNDRSKDVETYVDDENDDYYLNTKKITIASKQADGIVPGNVLQLKNIQYFPLSSSQIQPNVKKIEKATLYLYMPPAPSSSDRQAWLELQYVSVNNRGVASLTLGVVKKVLLRETRPKWIHVDVSEVLSMWLNNVTSNFGYKYSVLTESSTKLDLSRYEVSHPPFLILDIQENNNEFTRKQTKERFCKDDDSQNESKCCMWPLTIDFEADYGWDFIIHPKKFNVNFCSGGCKLRNRKAIASNFHSNRFQLAEISPCCTSKKFIDVNMLYFDDRMRVLIGNLPHMKVGKCGCS